MLTSPSMTVVLVCLMNNQVRNRSENITGGVDFWGAPNFAISPGRGNLDFSKY